MLRVDLHKTEGIAVIRVGQMQELTETDFKELTDIIDDYLEDHGILRGIVIVAKEFPGWKDFGAFTSHIKFVRNHHKAIGKVALVSDSPLLAVAPLVVDHFVNAKARHFACKDITLAKEWAEAIEVSTGHIELLDGYPDDVVAFRGTGTITHNDYINNLIPVVEERINRQGKVKLLFWCGEDFDGATAGAIWDDARFGMAHLGDFVRIAIVSDIGWLRQSAKLFAPLISAPVRVFYDTEIESAKDWISENQWKEAS